MNYNIYVVSLPDELKRRENIEFQSKKHSFKFEFVDAVNLKKSTVDELKEYISINNVGSFNRSFTKGEVGCALSHLKCYRKLLNDNVDWALVLEDDADLHRFNTEVIEKIVSYISDLDIDVVILGYSKLSKSDEHMFYKFEPIKSFLKDDTFCLGSPWRNWTCGTVSYLISKTGAQKMLNYFSDGKIVTVADDWRFFDEHVGLNILHRRPLLVFEDFLTFQSALEYERAQVSKRKIGFLDTVRFFRGYFRMLLMKLKP